MSEQKLQWNSASSPAKVLSGSANAEIEHHTVIGGFIDIHIETRRGRVVNAQLKAGPCVQHVESNSSLTFTRRSALQAAVRAAENLRLRYEALLQEELSHEQ